MTKKNTPIPVLSASDIATMDLRTDRTPNGCWEWRRTRMAHGYPLVYVSGVKRNLLAHRVAYFRATGEDPAANDVDHICHNRGCVNPDHLRAVTHKINAENRAGLSANNSSGVRGVRWEESRRKWLARVKHHGVTHNLGRYDTLAEAERVVTRARAELYTPA